MNSSSKTGNKSQRAFRQPFVAYPAINFFVFPCTTLKRIVWLDDPTALSLLSFANKWPIIRYFERNVRTHLPARKTLNRIGALCWLLFWLVLARLLFSLDMKDRQAFVRKHFPRQMYPQWKHRLATLLKSVNSWLLKAQDWYKWYFEKCCRHSNDTVSPGN